MPLSPSVQRQLMHTRKINLRGYERSDGLWDVEARMTDTKPYDFENRDRGTIKIDDPIHDMWIRMTFDDELKIHEVEAISDATPFNVCAEINSAFKQLEGLSIAPGWNKKLRTLLGGVHGCTHLLELMGPIATVAFQTIFPVREKRRKERLLQQNNIKTVTVEKKEASEPKDGKGTRKPFQLNTCHALRADGPIVQRDWPEFYTGT